MSFSTVNEAVSTKVADLINNHDDWSKEKKISIHEEYMKIFGDVWREAVTLFNKEGSEASLSNVTSHENQSTQGQEEQDDVEEAIIRHEATLIAVTKKRKEFPKHVAALLGKTTRLHKNTAESMKMDLSPRAPLEVDDRASHLDTAAVELMQESSEVLRENMHRLQPQNIRMARLVDAVEMLSNNQNDIVEVVMGDAHSIYTQHALR